MEESASNVDEEEFFIPGYQNAASYTQDALRSVLASTKAANALPSAGDSHDYYSTFPAFRTVLFRKGQQILSLMTAIIQSQGVREKFQGRELEDKFDLLVDANDAILEFISTYVDEASGLKKSEEDLVMTQRLPGSSINTSWNKKQFKVGSPKLLTAKNISRPQLSFKDKVDNSSSLFVPIIKEKPNSIKPLALVVEKIEGIEEFCHPYEVEIEKFKPNEWHLQESEPINPKPLEETPLVMVTTEQQLEEMCEELKKEKEIAVDLEHHSYRSFQGFCCLMQISTRHKDYIVDVLKLRSDVHVLNDVFTDSNIVKVLHGADMDILWLQRDFGLYIVNLFDTGQAARVLNFAHLSLSYLLKHYCRIDLDKKFQLADWRIRPLPAEMVKYARSDTHYLLYVYDRLKQDLIKERNGLKNLLHSTFERSKLICLKKYQKPIFSEDKYLDLYKKSKKVLNAKQLYCLKELYSWRDKIAREYDESLLYVLPNHMLLQIAEALPKEQQGILACCNPIPPLVKQQLNELHSIILKTNESSLKQLETMELQQKAQAPKMNNQIDLGNLIHCPHDIQHLEDRVLQTGDTGASTTDMPHIAKTHSSDSLLKEKPTLSAIFNESFQPKENNSTPESKTLEKVLEQIKKLMMSPFVRYKLTEELQSNEEKSANQISEQDQNQKNDAQPSANDSCIMIDDSVKEETAATVSETSTTNVSASVTDISIEVIESTPIRKKKNKKKRKPQPDISLIVTPESQQPPRKKQRTPEVVTLDDSFTPYDYSQSDISQFSEKKNSSQNFKQKKKKNKQSPKPYFGKNRKHNKQATFSTGSTNKGGDNSKWPKNK